MRRRSLPHADQAVAAPLSILEFTMAKRRLDRRLVQLRAEGTELRAGVVDRYLTGRDILPAPIAPTDRPLA